VIGSGAFSAQYSGLLRRMSAWTSFQSSMSRAMSAAAAIARGLFSPSALTSRARYASFAFSAVCTARCRASSWGSTPLLIFVADAESPSSSVRARARSLTSNAAAVAPCCCRRSISSVK
jgi:hypothetical protein